MFHHLRNNVAAMQAVIEPCRVKLADYEKDVGTWSDMVPFLHSAKSHVEAEAPKVGDCAHDIVKFLSAVSTAESGFTQRGVYTRGIAKESGALQSVVTGLMRTLCLMVGNSLATVLSEGEGADEVATAKENLESARSHLVVVMPELKDNVALAHAADHIVSTACARSLLMWASSLDDLVMMQLAEWGRGVGGGP